MSTIQVNSLWDYPHKQGFYWVYSTDYNDWIIAFFSEGGFYTSGTDELGVTPPNTFNCLLRNIKKYRKIPKPKE